MDRKQIVTTLSLGLMGMILLMSAGCDRFDLGTIDNNRDELDTVDPNLVRANTVFGFKLLNELRQSQQHNNTLLSPFSLSVALAMARNGAAGETERAIVSALQLQALAPESINANYVYLQRALQAPDSKVTLEIANALWAADDIEFDPGFLNRNNQFLDTEIATLDFTEPTNVDTINDSINTNTDGAIPSVVEAIDPQTIACLISGIYFKGNWQEEFDTSLTRDEPFTLANGDKKQIPMMRRTDWYPYYADDQFQAVSLPYEDGQMSMYIFLPNPDTDLHTFLDRLSVENWEGWMSRFSQREVSLVMPTFKLQYSAELKNALERLAMGIAFDEDRADFSRMTASSVPVFISYLTHTAVVEVNEEGTEASTGSFVFLDADVTTALAEESVPPIPFIVDRPFFLAIRDNQTGTVLFMGVVMEPTTVKKPPFIPEPPPIIGPPSPEPIPGPF
ncbi:proteinase inhibitor I4 serpin [Candidatus Poribacteria bacterium]|nr:MAG: proteinase inhibitor I4 serpin [Candidatus Poribacteria bacterium]